jgi:hypothetical protein
MRRHLILLAFSALVGVGGLSMSAAPASAHTGGPLDPDGCHADHRTGSYHCHRGAAAGYTFPNREAMLEAVRTGKFPEKTVEAESFFSKLWPWGKHHEQQSAEDAAAQTAPAGAATAAGAPASAKEREIQEKLKVLQGLYEMGLINKDEYEARRKTILEQI